MLQSRVAVAVRHFSNKAPRVFHSGPGLADFIRESQPPVDKKHLDEESTVNLPSKVRELSELDQKKFHIETYGCQMNSSDSEIVRAILLKHGYIDTPTSEEADIVLLNTCAIRENAEAKIWRRLDVMKQNKIKVQQYWKRIQKNKTVEKPPVNTTIQTVGVLGCMAERLKTKLLESDKMVDLVVGPDAYRDLPNLLQVLTQGSQDTAVNVQLSLDETYADIAPVRSDVENPAAFVSIMRGCNNMCSYCIVPFTRGRERSRDMVSILDNVQQLRDEGVREIVLLGQNVNSWHDRQTEGAQEVGRAYISASGFDNMFKARDAKGFRFADLLDRVSTVDPEIRIRFTSPHPKDFPDDVLHLVNERPNICKSIHMPVQHGNTEVLKRMRRGYSREAYLALVDNMRSIIPGVALSSDFIAGFCDETEEEHKDTISLMRHVAFDHAFMFAYSMRAKTHASHRMEDNVEEAIKLRRLAEVIDTYNTVVTRKNLIEDQDRLHIVLVQGASRRSELNLTGLTDTNKRCVFPDLPVAPEAASTLLHGADGVVDFDRLDANVPSVRLQKGDYVLVRVHEAGRHTLHATPIARTTLEEMHRLAPVGLLGARNHDLSKLEL
ncbi:CDK5 regulatory subunit-associated protein 1 [Thraustotheca clavata]|uniref:CDK5 regulatory subunit-associated protein 1 n=1 Tax=Thraustotheca clavata TaxID=74557 RepID=A0A1V9Y462_9STRA|nr:CDK5 regulatory subunit-associated protein 1 [Thraustotheca clavata]